MLRYFWESPERGDSEGPLQAWYSHVSNKKTDWTCFADVKKAYGSADLVGKCVVFNIAGNKYRLVVKIEYKKRFVFVKKVMTHEEYDLGRWKSDCSCFPPPTGAGDRAVRAATPKRLAGKRNRPTRGN
ncbi:MAG: type II toxin-antitoxin system HigB family toxin [Pirellulales bacterium]|nr:type II toxin-antitoxin system HigB family toxin [Pirellulales bacterium]